jgi:hypothetical protein
MSRKFKIVMVKKKKKKKKKKQLRCHPDVGKFKVIY